MSKRVLVILGLQRGLFDENAPFRQCVAPPDAIDRVRSTITTLVSSPLIDWDCIVHVSMQQKIRQNKQASKAEDLLIAHQSLKPGTTGAQVHPSLAHACPSAVMLTAAAGSNAFQGSGLDEYLSNRDLSQIIMVGATIGGMLLSTSLSAYLLGYEVIVPSDCLLACSVAELKVYLDAVLHSIVQVTHSADLLGGAA
ncbi:MAG: isochorismatase family protein [Phycisphaerales bacterium]|nr:isochorismatase family protein [Phycisphaerales bacterium]